MRQIICDECGFLYEDNLKACPNCGCPTMEQSKNVPEPTPSQQTQTCEECGGRFSILLDVCPNCGCPIELDSNNAKTIEAKVVKHQDGYVASATNKSTTKYCVSCDLAIPADSAVCPFCDAPQPKSVSPAKGIKPPMSSVESASSNQIVPAKASLSTKQIAIIVIALLIIVGGVLGFLYYKNVYLPKKIDAEAPRYYTVATNVRMRSTPDFDIEHNKLQTLPYGTELIVYDSVPGEYYYAKVEKRDARGKVVKDQTYVGYISAPYVMNKSDYYLLNSIFGNDESKKMLNETRYRRSLLNYFKTNGYFGVMSQRQQQELGIESEYANAQHWQVFCKDSKSKENSVYRARKYNKDSKYKDLCVIITNVENRELRLLYFAYDDNENEIYSGSMQGSPDGPYIKDGTLRLVSDYWSDDLKFKAQYTF